MSAPKNRRGGVKPSRPELHARAAVLMDQGMNRAEIAAAMDVEIGTAQGYICAVRRLRGLTKKTKRVVGPIRVRFEAKVDRNGPLPEHHHELGPCHVWIGAKQPEGYGHLRDHKGEAGPPDMHYRAHRLAWILAHGPIPEGLLVRHKCDRPSCVNLAHLELGTPQQNMDDKYARDRAKRATKPEHIRSSERARERLAARKAGLPLPPNEKHCSHCRERGHNRLKCPSLKEKAA